VRDARPVTLDQTFEELRDNGGFAWIGMYRPTEAELRAVADEFSLHPLAVEDALKGHQRPKLERYGDALFVVCAPLGIWMHPKK
jgi:magnesium transporter